MKSELFKNSVGLTFFSRWWKTLFQLIVGNLIKIGKIDPLGRVASEFLKCTKTKKRRGRLKLRGDVHKISERKSEN